MSRNILVVLTEAQVEDVIDCLEHCESEGALSDTDQAYFAKKILKNVLGDPKFIVRQYDTERIK